MNERERSPEELHQNSQDSEQQTSQNGFIKDPNNKLYLPKNYLSRREKKPSWLLKPRKGGKTIWDWLELLFVPALIAMIAGTFTLFTVSRQNEIFKQQNEISIQLNEIYKQRDEAEKERNQQALLIKYLDDISELVEKKFLTLNNDENSETQRTIATARTLSVLRTLDGYRIGALIQFLSAAKLIEQDKPIISLSLAPLMYANLKDANLPRANLERTYLRDANLKDANLIDANLWRAYLWRANLWRAYLRDVNLRDANLMDANLMDADLMNADLMNAYLRDVNLERANLDNTNLVNARELNPAEVKTACNWHKARFSKEFKQKLDQEPNQKVDCSNWN